LSHTPTGEGRKVVYVRVRDNAGLVSRPLSATIGLVTIGDIGEGVILTVPVIPAGFAAKVDFTSESTWITGVTITAASDVSGVLVWGEQETFEEARNEGEIETLPPGIVYLYLWDIETNLESTSIALVRLEFKIDREWINLNKIDEQTIKMYRFKDGWMELPTTLVRSDDKYFYYEAVSPGFSIFTAVGERRTIKPVPPVVPLAEPTWQFGYFSMLAIAGGLAGFAIIYALTGPSKYFALLRKIEKAVVKPKERLVGEPEAELPTAKEAVKMDMAKLKQLKQITQKGRKTERKKPKKADGKKSKAPVKGRKQGRKR